MSDQVSMGALLKCNQGAAPAMLIVLPANKVNAEGPPAANIKDHLPMVNIMPFAMCKCPGNPMVAAATAAAMGTMTPMPCIPSTSTPWMPGSPTVLIGGQPALNKSSTCMCDYGGQIKIDFPATKITKIP
jgi:hypothetical protein